MKTSITLAFTTLCCLLAAPIIGAPQELSRGARGLKTHGEAPKIRILVAHDVERAHIEVDSKCKMIDPYTKSFLGTCIVGRSRDVIPLSGGLKWGEEFPGTYQMKIQPESFETLVSVNGKSYQGAVYVYDIGGRISIVNEVPIEGFVSSVLAEPGLTLVSDEALSALAIAARTDALYEVAHPSNQFWHLDALEVGYLGVSPKAQHKRIHRVLNSTQNLIMSLGKDSSLRLFPARWVDDTRPHEFSQAHSLPVLHLDQAEEWGLAGQDASEILQKTFPNIRIQRLALGR